MEGFLSCAPKPMDAPADRRDVMIFSRPTNAPAKTNRMFDVSIVHCSLFPEWLPLDSRPPRSILSIPREFEDSVLEFRSGLELTVTVVPSIIFNRPCCTPSPLTSRPCVMTAGLASLSTSSKNMIPVSHFDTEFPAANSSRSMEDSISVPI